MTKLTNQDNNQVLESGFYTVTANFDMAQYGDLEVRSFQHLHNAIAFGEEMKEKFLSEIPDRELDMEDTTDEYCYFYGVSENGENFVTVRIDLTNFADRDYESTSDMQNRILNVRGV